jgi:molybdopterin synthase catalytic subunit
MAVVLRAASFDPWSELPHYAGALRPQATGATAAFVGTMRDFNEGAAVEALFLEHYPGMTERQLEHIVAAEHERHGLADALVIHRVGWIQPGEAIVLVAAWAAHRGPAFDACRAIMEALKARAPFWKHEHTSAGARWVRHNTLG